MYIALFAAITAALGLFPAFSLPVIAVPITAQTLGPMLAGAIAGAKRGALALVLFVLLVAIGLPLLAAGGGLGDFPWPQRWIYPRMAAGGTADWLAVSA
ncbi:biotin transporter BioY [Erwinia aphidicola]|uniref:biotin transporter BioY n=1 Tax=Erwinia aphidicola TaxID=68334 RepID=UPI0030CEBFB3